MRNKIDFFQERTDNLNQQINILNSKYSRVSVYRILVFILFLVFSIWSLKVEFLGGLIFSVALFLIFFILLVNKHKKIRQSKVLCQKLLEINQEEIKRLRFDFDGIFDGKDFVNESHPYASDLDIFGSNSIFQLINRACTSHGIGMLKSWLESPTNEQTIQTRQQAVKELIPLLEWRQKIHANGRGKKIEKKNELAFYNWLEGDDFIGNRIIYKIIPYVVMVISLVLIGGILYEKLPGFILLFPLIITVFFINKIFDYSRNTYNVTTTAVQILESVENIILLIENQKFENEYLNQLKNQFFALTQVASQKIMDLRKILELLNLRWNGMYHILNFLFLLDYIILAKAEKWRARYKHEISIWFETIAEFEALNSLAAFAFANDSYTFPEIMDKPFFLHGENIGHPLIQTEKRVNNDFSLENRGATCIITGSNMSGKSTFLRTLGANAVLAFAGAPVCAESFQISIFHIFTSMRTKDNLGEHISSFYAELIRLKMLLQQINDSQPTLYLLDEILKGTNSVDRHLGAESLILQLNEMNAFGLVSTHDLKLGELQKTNNKIMNYNFSSSIIGDEIVFDYKLRDGICESTNASQLMAKIGIQIKS